MGKPDSVNNEFRRWADLAENQKSYTVQVLHWFHYRPNAIGRSWTREEVLTWETVRALDLLPRDLFLRPLLGELASSNGSVHTCASLLAARHEEIAVHAFPSMGITGPKRNRRSDIGLETPGAVLWIEAKTTHIKISALVGQLQDQANALRVLADGRAHAVAALLPDDHPAPDWATVRWSTVATLLMRCRDAIEAAAVPESFRRGFVVLTSELLARLQGHCTPLLPNQQLEPTARRTSHHGQAMRVGRGSTAGR